MHVQRLAFNSKVTSGADQSDRTSLITSSSHSKASDAWRAKATVLSASGSMRGPKKLHRA